MESFRPEKTSPLLLEKYSVLLSRLNETLSCSDNIINLFKQHIKSFERDINLYGQHKLLV